MALDSKAQAILYKVNTYCGNTWHSTTQTHLAFNQDAHFPGFYNIKAVSLLTLKKKNLGQSHKQQ